jgi:fumarate hydratase, class II
MALEWQPSRELSVGRTVHDSFGDIDIPAGARWGAQTARSLHFFAIGEQRMPIELVRAMAHVKWAAASVNHELGLLDGPAAHAIAQAAQQVADGAFDEQFPLSVWQTGSGTQSHMNVNEVIAQRATQALQRGGHASRTVDAHDDVNRG